MQQPGIASVPVVALEGVSGYHTRIIYLLPNPASAAEYLVRDITVTDKHLVADVPEIVKRGRTCVTWPPCPVEIFVCQAVGGGFGLSFV